MIITLAVLLARFIITWSIVIVTLEEPSRSFPFPGSGMIRWQGVESQQSHYQPRASVVHFRHRNIVVQEVTSSNTGLLEKLVVAELFRKFTAFYGTPNVF
jgi:hypothetical protein